MRLVCPLLHLEQTVGNNVLWAKSVSILKRFFIENFILFVPSKIHFIYRINKFYYNDKERQSLIEKNLSIKVINQLKQCKRIGTIYASLILLIVFRDRTFLGHKRFKA